MAPCRSLICFRAAQKSCTLVNPNGLALGIDKGPLFARTIQERRLKLQLGDFILLYTDGVTEAFSSAKEEYGDERLYNFVKEHHGLTAKEMVRAITEDVMKHQGKAPQHDDITIVGMRAGVDTSSGHSTMKNVIGDENDPSSQTVGR